MVPLHGQELAFYTERLRSWAVYIPDAEKETLDNMISYLCSLRATLQGKATVTPEQQAAKDIRQCLLTTHLKSTSDMPHMVSSSLDLVMPGLSAPELRSPSSVGIDQFKADVSYMLVTRDLNFQRCMLRFGWADSSPQGPHDFFMWKFRYIFADEMSVTVKAMTTLITKPGGCLGGAIEDDCDISLTVLRERKEANAILKTNVLEHNSPQTTLGQGHTAASDKVSCGMHIHSLESHNESHCLRSIDEYLAFVTDLGTEVKITDFELDRSDLSSVLPRWLASRASGAPMLQDADDDSSEAVHTRYCNPLLQSQSNAYLRNAMPIPGSGHTVHNSIKDLHTALDHYQEFLDQLKVVELALHHPGRKERILATCFEGTPFDVHRGLVEHFTCTLYEERWGAVSEFCREVMAPLAVLRRCWSQSQYEGRGEAADLERRWVKDAGSRAFVPSELTNVLGSARFRHYNYMVVKLNVIPTRLMGWFDGCPCHHNVVRSAKTLYMRHRLLQEYGLDCNGCPCSSCRAWEVIDGRVDDVVKELGAQCESDIMAAVDVKGADGLTEPLMPADLSDIIRDYHSGLAFIQFNLDLRLSWRKQLPWMIMGMSHPITARAAHWAR